MPIFELLQDNITELLKVISNLQEFHQCEVEKAFRGEVSIFSLNDGVFYWGRFFIIDQ